MSVVLAKVWEICTMKRHLELWGGPECTINRVRDTYQDQFERCGHYDRIDDLNLFADFNTGRFKN